MDVAGQVGRRLRTLREAAGMSLSELARRSGVGKGTLSELEAGRRNPTLETLYALTTPLGVPLSAALPEPAGRAAAEEVLISGQAADALLVTRFMVAGAITEIYRLTVQPGPYQYSAPHTAGTTEHLVVLQGSARVGDEHRPHVVHAGASHSWAGDTPHLYAAAGPEAVHAVLVMRYRPTAGPTSG